MRILIKEKLSEHKSKTPEGYLICQGAILARTGDQGYLKSELYEDFEGEDTLIQVQRKPEQVFSSEALASFEDKPITIEHPDENVGPDNYNELAVGHVRNIRKGTFNGQDVMIGDLVITDSQAIEEIENGERTELSCGYDCDITDGDHPEQINIRGNHIALCKEGRAGIAKIIDSKSTKDAEENKETKKVQRLTEKEKNQIRKYLSSISTFTHEKDPDVLDVISPIKDMGYSLTRESINGWNRMSDGMYRKDYVFSFDGYSDQILISLYADPENFKVTEVNAYFTTPKTTNDSKTPWTVSFAWITEDDDIYTGTAVAYANSEDEAKDIVKSYNPKIKTFTNITKGALVNSFDYPYYYQKNIEDDDTDIDDTKIQDDEDETKLVVFNKDGNFYSTSYLTYKKYGVDVPKGKVNRHTWAKTVDEVVDYLIENAGLERDQIITIGDPSGKVEEVKDTSYEKSFYKNAVKELKKKKKDLESNSDEAFKDENDREFNKQKFNLYKLIKEQIDEYENDEDEADTIVTDSADVLQQLIKPWYKKEFPTDDMSDDISDTVTFRDVFECLDDYGNVYDVIGIGDSVIRERIFDELAKLMHVDYDYIYEQWLRSI